MITESKTRRIGEVDVIDLSGRLSLGNTLQTIERTIAKLIEDGSRKMVINLEALELIDSAGVGMLMASNALMEQYHGKMRVAGAQGAVGRVLEVVHLDRVVGVDSDVETACRQLG